MQKLEEMFERQMNKTRNNILQRKTTVLNQNNLRSLMKSKFKTD
jgi:hypothetical protein